MPTTTPELLDPRYEFADEFGQSEPAPRYALQRTLAARRGLATRLLLNRARSEGEAHRRLEESGDGESPFSRARL